MGTKLTTAATTVAALLLTGCGGADTSAGYEAEYFCEEFIKDQLAAPATAEFNLDHTGTGPTYTVTGTVDAENGFGAKLRSGEITCVVRDQGDRWRLESLDGI